MKHPENPVLKYRNARTWVIGALVGIVVTLTISLSRAQTADLSSTVEKYEQAPVDWMQAFPPPENKTIRVNSGDSIAFPRRRWSFSHMRELYPTKNVSRGQGEIIPLPQASNESLDIGKIPFVDEQGHPHVFEDLLPLTYADGLIVLQKGKVAYEKYAETLDAHTPHAAMSVTKSFVGLLAAMLAHDGTLAPNAPVTQYVPELSAGAYRDVKVQDVMDMLVDLDYSENYADPTAGIWQYLTSGGLLPRSSNYDGPTSLYAYLKTLRKGGQWDGGVAYKTVNTDVLAWIIQRASGQSLPDLLSARIWKPMGAVDDAYFLIDPVGMPFAGGGFNATLRDLARFGEVMRNGGRFNGKQIVPGAVVDDIRRGGDPEKFRRAHFATLPGWSYHDMWWASNDAHGVFEARGIYGQAIYIDPKAEMTIVRLASHPVAANEANDGITLPAFKALGMALATGHAS